jgi:hypothetical protein
MGGDSNWQELASASIQLEWGQCFFVMLPLLRGLCVIPGKVALKIRVNIAWQDL